MPTKMTKSQRKNNIFLTGDVGFYEREVLCIKVKNIKSMYLLYCSFKDKQSDICTLSLTMKIFYKGNVWT